LNVWRFMVCVAHERYEQYLPPRRSSDLVYDHDLAYVCEKAVGPGRSCDFRTGKIILQRNIEPDQVVKLLETGKTDLLHRFISKKGRPFSAFLVRQPDGRIGFEFAPREPKKGAKTAAKTSADAPAETPARPAAKKTAATKKVAAKKATAKKTAVKKA